MNAPASLPPVEQLSYGQYNGLNCVWCGVKLTTGAVPAGIAQGQSGAHILDTEVYACPAHSDGLTDSSSTGDAS